jgi:ferrochelatase
MTETALRAPADGFVSTLPETFFDAVLVVSFGGPEGMDDVLPFLENVTRGRNVPRERLEAVADHYRAFDGVSPINAQNRALIDALSSELDQARIDLPIYFGNRNWHPFLADTLRTMADDGVRRALAFFTSGFSCYSGCRQYRENIWVAQETVGTGAPEVLKTRMFWNHPGFVEAQADLLDRALAPLDDARLHDTVILFSAHSIPVAMARQSRYEAQLAESARLVMSATNACNRLSHGSTAGTVRHEVVYQSRSGPPGVPWLEPDVCDRIEALAAEGVRDVVVVPLGFVSDHLEVLWDLDEEAAAAAERSGLGFVRVASVGTHPRFVAGIRELIVERLVPGTPRPALGSFGPGPDVCAPGCCLPGNGRPSPWDG